jgi:hypothetical protein
MTMTAPTIHEFPVKRPGFIHTATWIGPDDDLALEVKYQDVGDITRLVSFKTRNTDPLGDVIICAPVSSDLLNLGTRLRDILLAHLRMASMISGTVLGSTEWTTALLEGESSNLNTALGVVKVTNIVSTNDQQVTITFRQGTGPTHDELVQYEELNIGDYVFVPETQLFSSVPGAIKKQFPTYVHNYPSVVLTQSRKDEIAAYMLTLEPWV